MMTDDIDTLDIENQYRALEAEIPRTILLTIRHCRGLHRNAEEAAAIARTEAYTLAATTLNKMPVITGKAPYLGFFEGINRICDDIEKRGIDEMIELLPTVIELIEKQKIPRS